MEDCWDSGCQNHINILCFILSLKRAFCMTEQCRKKNVKIHSFPRSGDSSRSLFRSGFFPDSPGAVSLCKWFLCEWDHRRIFTLLRNSSAEQSSDRLLCLIEDAFFRTEDLSKKFFKTWNSAVSLFIVYLYQRSCEYSEKLEQHMKSTVAAKLVKWQHVKPTIVSTELLAY